MLQIRRFMVFSSSSLASVLVGASYQVDAIANFFPGMPSWMLALLAAGSGGSLGYVIAKWIVSISSVRAILVGPSWVEGFWDLRTQPHESASSTDETQADPLLNDGVLYIRYDPTVDYFKVTTTRLDQSGCKFTTGSQIAHVRIDGTNIKYVNHFKLTYDASDRFGISHGEFESTGQSNRLPDWFTAQVFTEGDAPRRQTATRIDRDTVSELRSNYGQDWQIEFLKRKKKPPEAD